MATLPPPPRRLVRAPLRARPVEWGFTLAIPIVWVVCVIQLIVLLALTRPWQDAALDRNATLLPGKITGYRVVTREHHGSRNGRPVHPIEFTFEFQDLAGTVREGRSRTLDPAVASRLQDRPTVEIEVDPADPGNCRIAGTRRSVAPWGLLLIPLPCLVLGLVFLALVRLRMRRVRWLVEMGLETAAQVTSTHSTVGKYGRKRARKVRYSFRTEEGEEIQGATTVAPTPENLALRAGDRVQVLYDRDAPRRNVAWELLRLEAVAD